MSPAFFLTRYGYVYDPLARGWTPFHLWPSQVEALGKLERGRLAVILKARQLAMSWLTVGFGLWHMIFRPAATVLLFSQRDDEAVHLLGLARLYGGAQILVERNNHGHAVLQALRSTAWVVYGRDHAPGWLTTGASKAQAFAHAVAALRDRALIIHDEITYWQLASIDGGTMRAPQGQHDDRAMACILALAAVEFCGAHRPASSAIIPPKPLWESTPGGW